MLLFQKSQAPTYATITANAYNLTERLMRYQDFCVAADTLVYTVDGAFTIEELSRKYPHGERFFLYSYDYELKRPVVGTAFMPRIAREGKSVEQVRVTLDDGGHLDVTPDHHMVLGDGSTKEAKDLAPGESLMCSTVDELIDCRRGWIECPSGTHEQLTLKAIVDVVLAYRTTSLDYIRNYFGVDPGDVMSVLARTGFCTWDDFIYRSNEAQHLVSHETIVNESQVPSLGAITDLAPTCLSIDELASRLSCTKNAINTRLTACGIVGLTTLGTDSRCVAERSNVCHSVVSVEKIDDGTVYTLTVEKHHNFAAGCSSTNDVTKRAQVLVFITNSEMEYTPEIASALDIYCLAGDNKIPLLSGETKTVKELFDSHEEDFWVYSFDVENERVVPGKCKQVVRTGEGQQIYKVSLDNGTYLRLTGKHLVLLSSGDYESVENISQGTHVKSLFTHSSLWAENVVAAIELDGTEDVYDLQVDGFHNFAATNGELNGSYVFVHNSDESVATDEKGRVLHIYSDNPKIKGILEDLYYGTLNVEFNLRPWVRNLPVRRTTPVCLLDGRTLTIEDLAREISEGRENWTYSVQDVTHRVVPGKIVTCEVTRQGSPVVRVTLDDGTYVDTSPDHEYIMRDGSHVRADGLVPGASLMPLYTRVTGRETGSTILGYEQVYDPGQDKFVFTHRAVASSGTDIIDRDDVCAVTKRRVVHHKDLDKRNNVPGNLREMDWEAHQKLHEKFYYEVSRAVLHRPEVVEKKSRSLRKYARSAEGIERYRRDGLRRHSELQDPANMAAFSNRLRVKFDDVCLDDVLSAVRHLGDGKYVGASRVCQYLKSSDVFWDHIKHINPRSRRNFTTVLNKSMLLQLVERASGRPYHVTLKDALSIDSRDPGYRRAEIAFNKKNVKGVTNHKVVSVETLPETDDMYCLEVLGPNGEHDRHNFPVLGRKSSDGSFDRTSGIFVANCKFGDMFIYNDVSPEYGVMNAFPIPVNEVEREENYDPEDPFAVRFRWVTLGNRIMENWEVSHLRLLGNDMFLPYGSSIIEPARRVWRQLILIEDAMLVYRIVRAPERRVFYIDVANVPSAEVNGYMEQVKQTLRNEMVSDRTQGKIDLRYNTLPIHKDTPVPLLDGRTLTIEQLSKEVEKDERDVWVYSVQDSTHRMVPGRVVWCGKNYTASRLIRVWLDNESFVTTAPEHPFVLRNGTSRRADELVVGDSLMPLYRSVSSIDAGDNLVGYEKTYDPSRQRFVMTHRLVAEDSAFKPLAEQCHSPNTVIHHIDFNKRNNDPNNLTRLPRGVHWRYHADHCNRILNTPEKLALRREALILYNKTPARREWMSKFCRENRQWKYLQDYNSSHLHTEHNEVRRAAQQRSWSENKPWRSLQFEWIIPEEMINEIARIVVKHPKWGRSKVHRELVSNSELMGRFEEVQTISRDIKKFSHVPWERELVRQGYDKLPGFRRSVFEKMNHTVSRVEVLEGVSEDVYCMTVVGPDGEDDRHNFAVCGLKSSGDSSPASVQTDGVIVRNSVDADYFIPVRGGDSGTKIETLAGGQNAAAVEDVEYIQRKLFAALKVPKAYLGYDDMLCLSADTVVPLLDGTSPTIEELSLRDWTGSNDVRTYSCDMSGKIIPSKIIRTWKTKDVTELCEVTLDDESVFRCTSNHPFLCRDGVYKRADELTEGESLMPLYRKLSSRKERDFQDGYEKYLDNVDQKWKFTHRMVVAAGLVKDHESRLTERSYVVHHVDYNKRNNSPSNLVKMGKKAHAIHHSTGARANLILESSRDKLREVMTTPKYKLSLHNGIQAAWDRDDGSRRAGVAACNVKYKRKDIDLSWAADVASSCSTYKEFYKEIGLSATGFKNICVRRGIYNRTWLYENVGKHNHRVVSVRVVKLDQPVPVYDLEVEGTHNFAIQSGLSSDKAHGCVFVHNSSKSTLSQEDIRFSRTINVVQKTVVAELNKMAIIHLFANGFRDDDLMNFTLRLSNPSTIAQQQKLELIKARFDIAGSVPENMVDRRFVQREVMGLNKEEIEAIDEGLFEDAEIQAQLEAAGAEAAEGGAGGGGGGDLFGGGGGGPDLGGGEEEPAGEEPAAGGGEETEPLEAGADPDDVPEDEEDDELLLSVDDPNDRPVRVNAAVRRAQYNKSRRNDKVRRGVKGPNLSRTLGVDDPSMDDPNDSSFLKAVGRMTAEGTSSRSSDPVREHIVVPPDVTSMLRRMSDKTAALQTKMIVESVDVQDEIDSTTDSPDLTVEYESDDDREN